MLLFIQIYCGLEIRLCDKDGGKEIARDIAELREIERSSFLAKCEAH